MIIDKVAIEKMDRIQRASFVNSLSSVQPAFLIGSISSEGKDNLAIFNSVTHIGSNPALLAFFMRPDKEVRRHTFDNIIQSGFYTINSVHYSFFRKAHYTSAKFETGISEFDECKIEREYLGDFTVPFVKESALKIAMKVKEVLDVKSNDSKIVIGEIIFVSVDENLIESDGRVELTSTEAMVVCGCDTYYRYQDPTCMPFARPSQLPDFK